MEKREVILVACKVIRDERRNEVPPHHINDLERMIRQFIFTTIVFSKDMTDSKAKFLNIYN
jgi:hypothetical protein